MSKRNILLLEKEDSPWPSFLEEFFSDTLSHPHHFSNAAEASTFFSKNSVDMALISDALLSPALIQKLKAHRQTYPDFRIFALQMDKPPVQFSSYDGIFTEPLEFLDFQKKITRFLPIPEKLRVLMIDDEPEIAVSLTDFLRERTFPEIELELASNGQEGLEKIEKKTPDIIILDVKMPILNGIETYREIKKRGLKFPVIIHFDSVFGDEVVELHKIGSPAIVEKGGHASSVFDMMALILKMIYFA